MDLKERLTKAVEQVKQSKETTVASDPSSPDMISLVYTLRGDEPVAMFGCNPNRDLQLWLIRMAIVGLSADTVVFSMETCMTTHPVNPGTGKPWAPGEMQQTLNERPDWYVNGMITECVSVFAWDRAGSMEYTSLGFELKGNKVEWKDNLNFEAAESLGGYLQEQISLYWHDKPLLDEAIEALPDDENWTAEEKEEMQALSYEEKRAQTDMAVIRAIQMAADRMQEPVVAGLFMNADDPDGVRNRIINRPGFWDKEYHPGESED